MWYVTQGIAQKMRQIHKPPCICRNCRRKHMLNFSPDVAASSKPHSARPPLEAPEGVAAYAVEGGLVRASFFRQRPDKPSPTFWRKKRPGQALPLRRMPLPPPGPPGEVWRSGAWRRSEGSDACLTDFNLIFVTSPPLEAEGGC